MDMLTYAYCALWSLIYAVGALGFAYGVGWLVSHLAYGLCCALDFIAERVRT
jgi:hypothetical protein